VTETVGGVVCVSAAPLSTGWFEMPSLPYTIVAVLIPQGEEVVSFRLESGAVRELFPSVPLETFGGLALDDGTVQGISAPRGELIGPDEVFPRWRARHTGTGVWHGYRIASFEVYPVRYQLDTGRLTVDDGMTLVVETAPGGSGAEAVRERHVEGFRERAGDALSGIVVNPEDASSYLFDEIVVDEGDRGFMPAYQPGLEGSAVSYVIITDAAMSAEYQRLADWKTKKGIPTVVRTVEWIEQNFRSGADLGETVRNFIRAAYEKWGADYVLLGGDTDVIPARFAFTTFYTGDFIPTDMYYACLDGNWNTDGDSLWGEAYRSLSDPGDAADLYAEVFIGRLPSSTVSEARVLVDKTIAYETPGDGSYQDRVLLLGEVIFPSDYTPGDDIILDGAEILQSVYDAHLAPLPDATTTRLYENYAAYPGSGLLTTASSKDAMNAGTNHVVHAGHGYKYNMSVGNGSLLNYDAFSLTNGGRTFSMYLMNCTNVAFDTDCLAEYFLLNPGGGAFAVTGSSRSAFPSASRPYMDEYYSLIYDSAVVQLGRAFTLSREPFTPAAFGETADRWTHFIYNYLGDPEANMYRGSINTFVVSAPASLVFGENDVTVAVSSGGAPYDSALVCLHKSGDDYAYGTTGPSGQVTFADFLVRGGGSVTLTVTGLGHARYTGTIPVTLQSAPYLRVSSKFIDDSIAGNNDDVLDAGESVFLYVRLLNSGSTTARKLWAVVTALDPSTTMIADTALYPDIVPGSLAYGAAPFSFSVDPGIADEVPVEFRIDVHDSTGGHWSETFAFEAHAPELELFINEVSDAAPYGNGNGIIENGEQFLLKVGVKNFGSGEAYGLGAKLRAEDAGAVVTDSVSAYADVPLLGVGYGDGFVLSETNAAIANHLEFELVDQYGRVFQERLELRGPGAPHTI
ncbi:MAG: C25 family cysteine peptidase, partial [Candidatus Krumholzibacteria bacterium]|nr:C25 family cysteine peptidase [Candidatus Krumholzibacteria bacterium]